MSIEARAIELDEARKARILKSESIDVEKYLHSILLLENGMVKVMYLNS